MAFWSDHDGTKKAARPIIKPDIGQWSRRVPLAVQMNYVKITTFHDFRGAYASHVVCKEVIDLWQCGRLNQVFSRDIRVWIQKDKIIDGQVALGSACVLVSMEVGPSRTCPYELLWLRVARCIMVIISKACKYLEEILIRLGPSTPGCYVTHVLVPEQQLIPGT